MANQNPYLVKIELVPSDSKNINARVDRVNEFLHEPIRKRRDHHCTLTFAVRWKNAPKTDPEAQVDCVVKGVDHFGEAVVLLLDAPENHPFRLRNAELLREMEGHDQFPVYNPHVTIGYLSKNTLGRETKDLLEELFVGKRFSFVGEKGKEFDK
jgi:2'-5' RNA ligase